MRLGIVCGSFHRDEVERMLGYARDEAVSKNWEVTDVAWVPGSMEAPLALWLERLTNKAYGRRFETECRHLVFSSQHKPGWRHP